MQANDDRDRVAKEASNTRARNESGEPVEVAELLEFGHPKIVPFFSRKKCISIENIRDILPSATQKHPLKNRESLFFFVLHERGIGNAIMNSQQFPLLCR